MLLGFGFAHINKWIKQQDRFRDKGQLFINLMVMTQFIALLYNPLAYIPTPADKQSNQHLLEFMDKTQGEIFIPYRSHLPGFVDKEPHAHVVSIFELVGYFHGEVQPQGITLLDEIRKKISEQEYGAVILDRPLPWFEEELEDMYRPLDEGDFSLEGVRSQVMEWQNGLENIYVPINQAGEDDSHQR
jgi:hypothetical protein